MAYEYESRISNSISKNKDYFFTTTAKDMKNELREVYRKAKAFDRIKVIHSDYSIGDAKCIEMIGNELERADDER
ncbi:hypothetical protein [Staphylococcus xylosus]|uniref:hypothetical protein n=1 Tax=Staphylococcus xylosus TaxID=1288 RepID=UPI002DBFE298|nr:hypothetical protein [Staphylococcus xylosus]MEB8099181.1 hypothetical protein [Staphylococcus xylosus]MEB8101034.1 hypothetical protein [Staphylococcus xylosus]